MLFITWFVYQNRVVAFIRTEDINILFSEIFDKVIRIELFGRREFVNNIFDIMLGNNSNVSREGAGNAVIGTTN